MDLQFASCVSLMEIRVFGSAPLGSWGGAAVDRVLIQRRRTLAAEYGRTFRYPRLGGPSSLVV